MGSKGTFLFLILFYFLFPRKLYCNFASIKRMTNIFTMKTYSLLLMKHKVSLSLTYLSALLPILRKKNRSELFRVTYSSQLTSHCSLLPTNTSSLKWGISHITLTGSNRILITVNICFGEEVWVLLNSQR